MELWGDGVMECWSVGVLGRWSVGALGSGGEYLVQRPVVTIRVVCLPFGGIGRLQRLGPLQGLF